MAKMIFINLPVADVARAKAFYEAIGAKNNPRFSDASSACMVFSETIYAMLMTHAKWRTFTGKAIGDARAASEVMLALTCANRQEVDEVVKAAGATGGKADVNAQQDLGFMYNRSFEDLDGHMWEALWMDPAAAGGA